MEIILKKDVDNVGFTDDLVSVKNGYGRNFLIPQGVAVLATPSAKKVLAENIKQRAYKEKKVIDEAKTRANKAKELDLKITSKTGAGDKLFGSITTSDLKDYLAKHEVDIDKKFITILGGNIKRLGQYDAKLRFHRDVILDFSFEVITES
ncbi:LSU ribosomal protein L9p RplI [Psychroflexus torquis ATCC 700755]|jgi:large subunit ribosomal protein L9|uniref:Large ribosomal subunit protein bL9 n=1 Tax=Psychroflexus torquis (strain ATCC 700755 / CIP 106069 / ACAM 623) TaxID=313595 RepID=K4IKE0_PSYTT|nr:50S ribosomal protein L9 [Psychroflexus torquis]AFU70283.1 LSU ribosomal protein L9p RplI [Psychroflexus torquis ATCC 700755]